MRNAGEINPIWAARKPAEYLIAGCGRGIRFRVFDTEMISFARRTV
jgi:hypothetical protein